jgi:type IV secretion system protein VirD4
MMVSRQETQRALLTPGEIMQLPATDEIVMVSGAPPVQAKKLRYFEDGNFTGRVMAPAPVARAPEARRHGWVNVTPGRSSRAGGEGGGGGEDDGGLGLQPELELPEVTVTPEKGVELAPDLDDTASPEEAAHLRTVRRAAGLGQGDKDDLPDF